MTSVAMLNPMAVWDVLNVYKFPPAAIRLKRLPGYNTISKFNMADQSILVCLDRPRRLLSGRV